MKNKITGENKDKWQAGQREWKWKSSLIKYLETDKLWKKPHFISLFKNSLILPKIFETL